MSDRLPIRETTPPVSKVKFVYAPQSDITAQELANLLPKLMGKREISAHKWDSMGSERRHLAQKG